MATHIMAMVRWDVFRPGPGGFRVFDYGSKQKRLVEKAREGGTVWLVTSRKKSGEKRSYHLAYKLVDCGQIKPEESRFSGYPYTYVVRARDTENSVHFGYNDVLSTLRRLKFTSGRPMAQVTNIGLRLLTMPELKPEDVGLLERFENKILNSRTVFMSYAHKDKSWVERIERELQKRDVATWRDVDLLSPGQEFEAVLAREVQSTDCFIVLISPEAVRSDWVKREASWALSEYEKEGGLVKRIIPVVLPQGGWESFSDLHHIHHYTLPDKPDSKAFDELVRAITAS
jgi:hypothetical protein